MTAATAAPNDTEAYSRPVPAAPAWKTCTESTTKSARGIPNVIAKRSIAKLPISAPDERTWRRPSTTELTSEPSWPPPVGSCGPIVSTA